MGTAETWLTGYHDYHHGDMDVHAQKVRTFHMASDPAPNGPGSATRPVRCCSRPLWFCTSAGFLSAFGSAVVLAAVAGIRLRERRSQRQPLASLRQARALTPPVKVLPKPKLRPTGSPARAPTHLRAGIRAHGRETRRHRRRPMRRRAARGRDAGHGQETDRARLRRDSCRRGRRWRRAPRSPTRPITEAGATIAKNSPPPRSRAATCCSRCARHRTPRSPP